MDNNELQKFMRKQMKEDKKNKKEDPGCNDKEDGVVRKSFGGFGEEKGENPKLQFKRNFQLPEERQVGKVWAGMKCEEEITITIRLVFGQQKEICFQSAFKAKLSGTKAAIVDTFCSAHRGLRPEKVATLYVLEETRATQMVRRGKTICVALVEN